MSKKDGFTLIEVLTVIMIIAILASVVLVSLQSARDRGRDVTIQQQIAQVRSLAEAGYSFSNGYKELYDMNEGTHSDSMTLTRVKEQIINTGGELVINFTDPDEGDYSEYCAYSQFVRNTDMGFCADSTGNAVEGDFASIKDSCDNDIVCEGVGTATGCTNDGDCSGATPYCVGSVCVECRDNNDCSFGYVCSGNQCVEDN